MQKLDQIQKLILNYFSFSSSRSSRINKKYAFAIAIASSDNIIRHELISEILETGKISFHFVLKKYVTIGKTKWAYSDDLSELDHIWLDFVQNDLIFPLMSERLRDIIISCLNGNGGIDWLPVMVHANNEQRQYFVPNFENKLDVLNEEKTQYVRNTDLIFIPVFSFLKIAKYSIFHVPSDFSEIPKMLYINGETKKKIQKEKLTGIYFEKIYNIWS
jgi:hypothetical protein